MSTILAGSLEAAGAHLDELSEGDVTEVVIVPTAAAFVGVTESVVRAADELHGSSRRLEGLMVASRADAHDPSMCERVRRADLVVLLDGSALHARSVWRDSPFGEAVRESRRILAVGDVASVIFDPMIDPRGGAPTTGLGYRTGLAVTTRAEPDQLARTRSLLGEFAVLCVLERDALVVGDGESWRVVAGGVEVTRGTQPWTLAP